MPTLYIIRGLPGTGKSTLAKTLCPDRNIAADDYPGRYLPDGKLNPQITHAQAHEWVRLVVRGWMADGEDIAVSNVFSRKAHIEPFLFMAIDAGYSSQVIECQQVLQTSGLKAEGIHNVPESAVQRWRGEWEPLDPPDHAR